MAGVEDNEFVQWESCIQSENHSANVVLRAAQPARLRCRSVRGGGRGAGGGGVQVSQIPQLI